MELRYRLFFLEPREDEHILTRAITHLDQSLETRKVQLKAVQDYVENDKQCKQALSLTILEKQARPHASIAVLASPHQPSTIAVLYHGDFAKTT